MRVSRIKCRHFVRKIRYVCPSSTARRLSDKLTAEAALFCGSFLAPSAIMRIASVTESVGAAVAAGAEEEADVVEGDAGDDEDEGVEVVVGLVGIFGRAVASKADNAFKKEGSIG